jgi:Ca-activated chloride channel homolog
MLPVFAQPLWLLLLLVPFGLAWWQWRQAKAQPALTLPTWRAAAQQRTTWRVPVRRFLWTLKWGTWTLLVLAMARPQWIWSEDKIKADAVDIVLSLDISPSMLSRDFLPDRLTVAKQMASVFVKKRTNDRIGLVAFAGEAFTQCPLTTDEKIVSRFIQELEVGVLVDGTSIGLGLATAVNRLKTSTSKSRIIILLTDGEDNAGFVAPETAMDLAASFGIKVYTIGLGTEGIVESPVARAPNGDYFFEPRRSDVNFDLLYQISQKTGGKFFRARSPEDLEEIYGIIDGLEKTRIEVTTLQHSTDLFGWLIGAAVLLIIVELLLRYGLLRSVVE